MPIEDILKEIEEKGKLQVEEIRKETEEKVSKIINESQEKSKKIIEEGKESFRKYLENEKKRRISTINMEMRMKYIRELNNILDLYVESLKNIIKKFRNSENYKNYIVNSIEKGKKEIGGDVKIIISFLDKDLVKNEKNVEFSNHLDSLGGVILESIDGKKRADYSISTLIEEKYLEIKQEIYERMKGEI
ncbi:MAG: V-type ATP synthase subunit E family protein [Thermoplasmata archaeon]